MAAAGLPGRPTLTTCLRRVWKFLSQRTGTSSVRSGVTGRWRDARGQEKPSAAPPPPPASGGAGAGRYSVRRCLWVPGSGASPAFQGWTTAGPSLLYPLRGPSAPPLLSSSCSRTYSPRTPLNSSSANPVREQMRLACHNQPPPRCPSLAQSAGAGVGTLTGRYSGHEGAAPSSGPISFAREDKSPAPGPISFAYQSAVLTPGPISFAHEGTPGPISLGWAGAIGRLPEEDGST